MSGKRNRGADALLKAIADSAVALLRFHDLDRSLPKVLETLGTATGADRMHLMQIEPAGSGDARCVRHHSWCAPGIGPATRLANLEGRSMRENGFASWADGFARGKIVCGMTEGFETPIREFLESNGVRSLAVVPVFAEDRWWGAIGFDDCCRVRKWRTGEVDALRTLAELVGAAVARSRQVQQMADAHRIIESSPTILFRLGAEPPFPLRYVSPNIARYGYSADELLSRPTRWVDLIDMADLPDVIAAIHSIVDNGADVADAEFRLLRPDGSSVWFDGRSSAFRNGASELVAIEGIVTDVTERKEAAREMERLAHTDPLTGLANRKAFLDRLAETCARAGKRRTSFAVHFIDLDRFKAVNDTLGHPVGDKLLKAVARRVARAVREGDMVARFGGDEFAVLQTDLPSARFAERLANKICRSVSQAYKIGGHRIEVGASVGLACHQSGPVRSEDVLTRADLALYQAKEDGRNRVQVYDPSLQAVSGTAVSSNLRAAPAA